MTYFHCIQSGEDLAPVPNHAVLAIRIYWPVNRKTVFKSSFFFTLIFSFLTENISQTIRFRSIVSVHFLTFVKSRTFEWYHSRDNTKLTYRVCSLFSTECHVSYREKTNVQYTILVRVTKRRKWLFQIILLWEMQISRKGKYQFINYWCAFLYCYTGCS